MVIGQKLADRFGAPLMFDSYDSLLASKEIDAVYIPLPTSDHVKWSLRAANMGKRTLRKANCIESSRGGSAY